MTTEFNKEAPARLPFVDGLRGLACLGVVAYHSVGAQQTDQVLRAHIFHGSSLLFYAALGFGWAGVPLFLVLSGFCLYYPPVRRNPPHSVDFKYDTFMARRARRILPPYYAALAIFTLTSFLHQTDANLRPVHWYDLLMHVLMIHNLRNDTVHTINGPFWSLALEWQMYLIFPLFIALVRRWNIFFTLAVVTVISILWDGWVHFTFGNRLGSDASAVLYQAVPGFAVNFVSGMCAAVLVARPSRSYLLPAVVVTVALGVPAIWYFCHAPMHGTFVNALWGLIFGALVVVWSYIPEHKFSGKGVLRAIAFLGTFSYSVYLTHSPVLGWLDYVGDHMHVHGTLEHLWKWARLAVVALVGYQFFRVFERPFIMKRSENTAQQDSDQIVTLASS